MSEKRTRGTRAWLSSFGWTRASGLQSRLMRSHFTIASIGIVLLLVAVFALYVLRLNAIRLARLRGPTARTSMLALSGTNRSLAGLRGWVVLGDPRFLDDLANAWQQDIRPALSNLNTLSQGWTNETNHQRLADLQDTLDELEKWQREVARVAQSPANEPARLLLEQQIRPLSDNIVSDIAFMIESELNFEAEDHRSRKKLLGSMSNFRGAFTLCLVRLANVVDTGSVRDEEICRSEWDRTGEVLAEIIEARSLLSDEQRNRLLRIQNNIKQYVELRERALEIRKSDEWNASRHLLATECLPRSLRATELLTAMSTNQDTLMREDADRVTLISNTAIACSIFLVLTMAVSARVLSKRSAVQISQPLATLSTATRELAAGTLTQDIPVPDDTELGELTRAFNEMRLNLQQSEERFRHAIEQAPFPIMIHSEDGVVHKINKVWTEITGYEPGEIPTLAAWTKLAYGKRMEIVRAKIDEMYSSDSRVYEGEFEPVTRNGEKRIWDFSSSPLGTTPEGKRLVLSIAMDITERKHAQQALQQAHDDLELRVTQRTADLENANRKLRIEIAERERTEEALRESEQRFELAVRGTTDGIWDSNLVTGQEYWSPRLYELLGYAEGEIAATFDSFLDLLHPDDKERTLESVRRHWEEREPYDIEFRMRTKTDDYFWFQSRGQAVWDENDRPVRMAGAFRDIAERKKTETQLRIQAQIIDQIHDSVVSTDLDGFVTSWNQGAERLSGYTAEEMQGQHISKIYPKSEHEFLQNDVIAPLKKKGNHEIEVRIRRKSGEFYFAHLSLSMLHDENGRETGMIGYSIDITERVLAEDAMRLSSEIMENMAEGVILIRTSESQIVYSNSRFDEIFGYEAGELVGKQVAILNAVGEKSREDTVKEIIRAIEEQGIWSGDIHNVRKDGTTFWTQASVSKFEHALHGQVFVSVQQDVTARKRAEEALKANEKQLQDILDSMFAFVGLFTTDGILIEANRAPLEAAGLTREDVIGTPFWDTYWWSYSSSVQAELKAAFDRVAQGETVRYDVPVRVAGGEFVTIDVVFSPLYDDSGKFVQIVGSAVDITDRKRVEQEREALIEQLEHKNAEMERFTYTVSHDLKSPLITIRGFTGLLEKDAAAGDAERMRKDISHIISATDKMQRLLDELLQMSRIGRLLNPSEHFSLRELAQEAIEQVGGQIAERGVTVEISDELPETCADRQRLLEVMQNLVDNAVKFMGDQSEPYVEIGSRTDNGETVCFVRDNGIGIDPRFQEKVFGLFDRLDQETEGTGIGLSLSKRIVEHHGGRIWIESEGRGKGCTVCFTIPENKESDRSERAETAENFLNDPAG